MSLNRKTNTLWCSIVAVAVVLFLVSTTVAMNPIPFAKQAQTKDGSLTLSSVKLAKVEKALHTEATFLKEMLEQRGIHESGEGIPVRLRLTDVEFPPIESQYRADIEKQGYRIVVDANAVTIEAESPVGVFYGTQTLDQLIAADGRLPCCEIIDWPDLAIRGIMVDTARANENLSYYKRVVDFCARYKINRLHMHLTDDENACLYQEDFPWLMHPNAWRSGEIAELVAYAQQRHIEILPEIESLGHARMFVRHPKYKDILHQTTVDKPAKTWAGTDVPGFTNVLCPASPLAIDYLDKMYARTAQLFPMPETHIGFDEVDMTECARCKKAFGEISHSQWLLKHLLRCIELASRDGRRVALWGDMLLNHKDIVDQVPRDKTVIYDWHYRPKVSDDSVKFFKDKGFQVIGCPALVCHPHMVMSSDFNYKNIARFAEVARDNDILGMDTTVWTPIRYMSDVLWPGMAYAAVHSWSGSRWDEDRFYELFAMDFFGLPDGVKFGAAWTQFYSLRWWLDEFRASCWHDEAGWAEAKQKAEGDWGKKARRQLESIRSIQRSLEQLTPAVKKNQIAWRTMLRSVEVAIFVREHFLAAAEAKQQDGQWNLTLIKQMDERCVKQMGWIEEDWARNRFADDPYQDDLNNTRQHLLDSYRKIHAFHQEILSQK